MNGDILETKIELMELAKKISKLQNDVAILEGTFDTDMWRDTKYLSADLNALRVLLESAKTFCLSILSDESIFEPEGEEK